MNSLCKWFLASQAAKARAEITHLRIKKANQRLLSSPFSCSHTQPSIPLIELPSTDPNRTEMLFSVSLNGWKGSSPLKFSPS